METKTVNGVVESVESKLNKNGNMFYKLRLDGRTYNTYEDVQEFSGKYVELQYIENPNLMAPDKPFKNIIENGVKIIPRPAIVEPDGKVVQEYNNQDSVPPSVWIEKDKRKARVSALASAVGLAKSQIEHKGESNLNILAQAEKFFEYIWDGYNGDA